MAVLAFLASVANYASTVIFSRILTPAGFGDLTALLVLAVVLAVPTGAAQTVIAERIAGLSAEGHTDRIRFLIRHALGHVVAIGLLVAGIYTVCIPLVVAVLNLEGPGPAIALAPVIALAFVQPLALGVLQGLDRFTAFGAMLLAIAICRIAFGAPWAALPIGGAGGAIAGQGLGMALCLVGAGWILREHLMARGTGAATSGVRRRPNLRTISASAAFVAFALISNLDVLLAKLFLTADEVGQYAALATIGKIVTFLPASVAVVMVPNAARARHSRAASLRVLRIAAVLVAATALIAALPAALAPELAVRVMFGDQYLAAAAGVLPIVVAGSVLAVLYLLVVYTVAIEDRHWTRLLLLGIVLQVVGTALFHESPAQVAMVQAFAVSVVLMVNEGGFHSLLPLRERARATD